jgi:hypothetical protein
MLQGRITAESEPVQAPLPRHATRMLDGLRKTQPTDTLEDFQTELLATRDLAPEVTHMRRAAHLALLFLFLYAGLVTVFAIDWLGDFAMHMMATFEIPTAEQALVELDRGSARDFLSSAIGPDPFARLAGAMQLGEDLRLRQRLEQNLRLMREEQQARLRAFTWYTREFAFFMDRNAEAQQQAAEQLQEETREKPWARADFRARAQDFAGEQPPLRSGELPLRKEQFFFSGILPFIVISWPAVWVIWAFITRGGLSFWIMGLSLVRSTGRPALRLQCAWRALLVWLPVTGLLLLSAWCNATYWVRWLEGTDSQGLLWLSCLTYWAAGATVLGYVALCVWMPNRSLHDRLAGTYLVPL